MKNWRPFYSNAVWPPWPGVLVFLATYGVFNLGVRVIARIVPEGMDLFSELPELVRIRTLLLALAACGYALFRLIRFHPACNHRYSAWLQLSPWTANRPLPAGPVHLVGQDAIVIGALTALAAWHTPARMLWPAGAFGLAYLAGLTFLLLLTRIWKHCVVLGFLWPALFLPQARGWPMVVLAAALAAVVWHGHRASLRAFPWTFLAHSVARPSDKNIWQIEITIPGLDAGRGGFSHVGWPWHALAPKPDTHPIRAVYSFTLSVLLGWWTFCGLVGADGFLAPSFIVFLAVIAAMLRLIIYRVGVLPSFNILGRLTSGRWVVPGFDRVFITPLVIVTTGIVGAALVQRSGAWHQVMSSGVVALLVFLCLGGGPTLRNWRLTGQHRYCLPARQTSSRQQLQPT